ncbi:MAG: adenylate/guanylate cyclase domain-containing protein [Candidatus Viridilinea halotolerans]|uniref:Adenylate/guanylate cyclase domain-containing protein n=1 Tax=Candidatus Viridilinea halotolerans TaxID=2491704 RepID=A0A426TT25_9CHLR|nr:MAG: adenylate/guanylate cyclase domain-containing protein [Candidatus Viridilinea halotolerans]
MTTLAPLEELASYVPALILRHMAADEQATLAPACECFPAALLFADLSGFTALTERLARQSLAGAEELTRILDLYFGHLVAVVTSHGGDVVKFAGDGLLALWYGPEALPTLTQRAIQCGLAVQMMMAPDVWASLDGDNLTPPLKVRVGVGAGTVTAMRLGGVFGRWELLIAGEAVKEAGLAEAEARSGDVVISARAWGLVQDACFGTALPSGSVRLDGLIDAPALRALVLPPLVPAMAEPLRAFVPKAILARTDAGQTAWLAEQRRISVLFVRLLDLHADTPLAQAQAILHRLQRTLYRYEGSITRLGADAQGPTLVAVLGLPPLAHENDAERAVRVALAIRAALHDLGCRVAIGVSSGRALCSAVGGKMRREYTMMGPMVNRSARLMQAALKRGTALAILCDEQTFRATRTQLTFTPLAPLSLKGFTAPVPVFSPLPDALSLPLNLPEATLIGRTSERQLLAARIAHLRTERSGGIVIIEGEAGLGKSALLNAARELAQQADLIVLNGAGSPLDLPPYHAWCAIYADLLPLLTSESIDPSGANGFAPASADDADQIARELARRALLLLEDLELSEFAPLLAAVAPLSMPETAHTAALAGQTRADQTRDLLVRLLAHAATRSPLLLIFEDAQWLDANSWALLHAAITRIPTLLCLLATRPMASPPLAFQQLAYRPDSVRMQLTGLTADELRQLLARRLGVAKVPNTLSDLISARAQGNPFMAEEILTALRERGLLEVNDGICQLNTDDPGQLTALGNLPDTIEGLIISRIDRLTAAQQLTLKVASVIGQCFALNTLAALHPVEDDHQILVAQLFALQQAGLVVIEAFEPTLIYAFKHVVGCEVAYNLMSFGQRRQLHEQLATYCEAQAPGASATAVQLAHHWRQAGQALRAIPYLAAAGNEALQAGAYNEAARLLDEALTLATQAPDAFDQVSYARWERQLGATRHALGQHQAGRDHLLSAVARLGYPLEVRQGYIIWALVGEIVQWLKHHWLGPTPPAIPEAARAEVACAYHLLAQWAYHAGHPIPALYVALRRRRMGG